MIPTEQNDRLLELAYAGTRQGCRHHLVLCAADDWGRVVCAKCGQRNWPMGFGSVGDGHQMTLGEMVRLARTRFGCEVCIAPEVVEVWYRGVGRSEVVSPTDDIEPVLAQLLVTVAEHAAILAAVDGAK